MGGFDFEAAIRLFDETTGALSAQVRRLEEVLTAKQAELVETNRRLTEKVSELDRMTSWLHLIMGAVASGVVAVDERGVVTACNQAAVTALAGELEDPIDADYLKAFPNSPMVDVLRDGRTVRGHERRVRRADAPGRRILSCQISPLRAPDGHIIGAVEVFDDVTEVRQLRERAERADRLKQLGEMAAGVAHEIRNPLNGIEGFASLLVRDIGDDPRRARYATAIIDGVRDLNRTVSGLLEFTKSRRIERQPADPGALLQACVDLLRADDSTAGVDLRFANTWDGSTVSIDAPQIKQVLLNLLQNAVHAVVERDPPGGTVAATIERDAVGALVVCIDDDGPGVPESERQRIFTPFHTTRDQGTGLGLAVSFTIVQLHGGALTVEDSPLGGARFRFVIP